MKNLNLDKKLVSERIGIIQTSLNKLEGLQSLSAGHFMMSENFAIAEHYLRYALEATFDICAYVLPRIPGAKVDEYKQMAIEMGRQKVLPREFAEESLFKMAGYRNRLTHFYFEIRAKEMYDIIQHNLGDFEVFLKYIKKLL